MVSRGQYFVTIHDVEIAKLGCPGACRKYTLPQDHDSSQTKKGWIRRNKKIGPALEVAATCHLGHHGIEIKIDSLQNDGSQSWVLISTGKNKCVKEMPDEHEEFLDNIEEDSRIKSPVATNSTQTPKQASSSLMRATCRSIKKN